MKKWSKPEIKIISIQSITLSGSTGQNECGNNGASKGCSTVF